MDILNEARVQSYIQAILRHATYFQGKKQTLNVILVIKDEF